MYEPARAARDYERSYELKHIGGGSGADSVMHGLENTVAVRSSVRILFRGCESSARCNPRNCARECERCEPEMLIVTSPSYEHRSWRSIGEGARACPLNSTDAVANAAGKALRAITMLKKLIIRIFITSKSKALQSL